MSTILDVSKAMLGSEKQRDRRANTKAWQRVCRQRRDQGKLPRVQVRKEVLQFFRIDYWLSFEIIETS